MHRLISMIRVLFADWLKRWHTMSVGQQYPLQRLKRHTIYHNLECTNMNKINWWRLAYEVIKAVLLVLAGSAGASQLMQ